MSPQAAGSTPSNGTSEWAQTAHMATTTLKVDGMTCGACTSAVESGFQEVDGAGSVSVSLVMGRAVVQHDPQKLSAEQVAEIIEDRGFDAEVLSTDLPIWKTITAYDDDLDLAEMDGQDKSTTTVTTLAVQGMTCGACTSAVESGFKDVAGVMEMSVSLLSERAVVEHDASIITAEQVAEIIEDRGFDATILDSAPKTADKPAGSGKSLLSTTTVAIEGMTCGACTSAVEGAFKDVEGLVQFNISLLAERAVISHDAARLTPDKIVELIDDAGFDAKIISSQIDAAQSASSTTTSIQFKIYGVPDGASATALEDLLRRKIGVQSATLSLSTSRATVAYDSKSIGLRALVETIEGAGYNALVADNDDNNAQLESLAKTKEIQEWRRSFWVSLSFAIPVFFISMIIPMVLPFMDMGKVVLIPGLFLGDVVCLCLTIPVQFGIGKRFYISSYKSLKHGAPTMDVLVVLGTSAAFFFSVGAMLVSIFSSLHTRPSTVFDTSTMLITFISLGRYLENRAKGQTSKALSRLMSLAPSMASIYDDPIAAEKAAEGWEMPEEKTVEGAAAASKSAGERMIPTELIQVGDIVILRPGDKVPADGTVTRGESYIDESMVTGEAMPILKKKGSSLMAGTVNGAGRVDFRVTRAGRDTQLSQIVKLVQEAQTSRAPIQRMADVVAGYFVPTILALGLATFVGWMVLSHALPHPPKIFIQEGSGGKFMVCLKLCISVIVFACPCALGLSTPTAVMVGTGVGAEHGILVKGGAALEMATKINHVVLDKTGTLTMGKMSVVDPKIELTWASNEWRKKLWWTIVGLAETGSEHPVAKAILGYAKEALSLSTDDTFDGVVTDFEAAVGRGVSAVIQPNGPDRSTFHVLIGNAKFLRLKGVTVPESVDTDGEPGGSAKSKNSIPAGTTLIHVAISSAYAGTLSLRDTVKPSARAAIAALHRMNIATSLVTGDTYNTAYAIARHVGIPTQNIHASVSPSGKKEIVQQLQEPVPGQKPVFVAMVGDGINDSPALATASVGIALASGTDVAMEAADVVLMRPDDLLSIPASISLSRTIFRRIKMNLGWACLYNIIGLPFAMGLFLPFGGISLHPMAAGAAMALSSVSVVASSLLLKFWQRPSWMNQEALDAEGFADFEHVGGEEIKPRAGQIQPSRSGSGILGTLPRRGRALFRSIKRTVLDRGKIRSLTEDDEEGYVPLQSVEPV